MINQYLSNFSRILKKNFSGTALAIIGLAIGLSSFMLILSYVNYEFSFDKNIKDYENTYRFTTDLIWQNGDRQVAAVSPIPSAKHLVKDFPEITDASCFFIAPKTLLSVKSEVKRDSYFEEYLLFSDEHFPDLFNVHTHNGEAAEMLKEPHSLIISESTGKKLFGKINPIGEIIEIDGMGNWTIKGVIPDYPANSHIRFNMLASIVGQEQYDNSVWRTMNAYTYFKVLPATNVAELEKKFESLIDNYMSAYKNLLEFRLQPLSKIHLYNDRVFDYAITSNIKNIYILLSIGILILIIASFNYSNLLMSKNKDHQKEMGIKKILGAAKSVIFTQLFIKGILIAFTSILFGAVLTEFTLPILNGAFNFNIQISFFNYLLYGAIILAITGLLSVTFPTLTVARINTIHFLNNFKGISSDQGNQYPQRLSLIIQFALTIVLIIGAIFTYKQLLFLKNKELGFEAENVLVLEVGNDETYKIPKLLKRELLKHPGILNVGLANGTPGEETSREHFIPEGFENHLPLNIFNVDAGFVPSLKLQILAGRNFNPEFKQDSAACIINESTLKKFGWSLDEAIGKKMKWNFAQSWDDQIDGEVIGVVKDFNFRSLHQPLEELVITSHTKETPVLLIQLLPGQTLNSVKYVERKFAEINPGVPFEYSFLKTDINQLYSKDHELRMLITIFSAIAILISCLGLYSYSKNICRKKVKEIGIRKVNGATITEILTMLNIDFVKWVVIAFVIVTPVAYYAINKWLEIFAYKTSVSWWIFALAGVLALGIALLTVSWQSWKAATRNPVEALRYE